MKRRIAKPGGATISKLDGRANYAKWMAVACLLTFADKSVAQSDTTSFLELSSRIKAPNAVAKIGADLFGDQSNLYNGSLEFVQVDVDLPGNSSLKVMAGRRLSAGVANRGSRAFGLWDLEIPHLHGMFSYKLGWQSPYSTGARCSDFGPPPSVPGTNNIGAWDPEEYWQGNFMYIPGVGDQLLLRRSQSNTVAPGPVASYPVVTAKSWSLSCLSTLANDSSQGEGFLAVSPDGTQYRFDQIVSFPALGLTKSLTSALAATTGGATAQSSSLGSGPAPGGDSPVPNGSGSVLLQRKEVWLLPTKITDRFGNYVNYTYDTTNPGNLLSITASDGRQLTFTYNSAVTGSAVAIASVSDGTRSWTYNYHNTGILSLDSVVLPDSSSWSFANTDTLIGNALASGAAGCEGYNFSSGPKTGSMVHPSGAVGTFTVTPTLHGRSNVLKQCNMTADGTQVPVTPKYFFSNSLTQKTVTGPGLPSMSWDYAYSDATQDASWSDCTTCKRTKSVNVTDPAGNVAVYTYGNRYEETEGQLQQVDIGWNGSSALQTKSNQYRAAGSGPYPDTAGYSNVSSAGDSDQLQRYMPLEKTTLTQQGVTFTWQVNAWDTTISLPRPVNVTRSSTLGYSRTESIAYSDNLSKYVLGQIASVSVPAQGVTMVSNTYDPSTATLKSVSRFGHLDQTFTYNADGTLYTKQDGNNYVTTYTNYKRGVPQNISYPNSTAESAVVNNIGLITSYTNAAGSVFGYGYDALGRLASITYPAADTVSWNPTTVTFSKASAAYNDLAAGHWQQEVVTGTGHTVYHYDGFWRPVYTDRWDGNDSAGTRRVIKYQYDFNGNKTFESYPQRSAASTTTGVSSTFDALSRPLTINNDSELGTLTSWYSYNSGFQTSHTDNRNHHTVYGYQAFDQPVTDAIASIQFEESVAVNIARDVFGKALSITRTDGTKTATKNYVYDGYQRLCKTIEPETKATIQDYDGANNVLWRAPGQNLLSTTSCDISSVPAASKITYGYDAVNQLKSTTYGDNSPAISITYTGDGLPYTVSSNGAVWTYTYNKRRLNERESLAYGGTAYNIDWQYDANGSVAQLTYPVDGLKVTYAPNALGEPTRVGSYATGITRYPNGAVASFTYGNGIAHSMTQNGRGLPGLVTDTNVIKDQYTYDENANVSGIIDQLQGLSTRSMQYDGLDRLKAVSAPSMWGTASYTYDGLDNLTSTTITAGSSARTLTHNFDPATNRLSSTSNGPAAFNFVYQYDARGNITARGAQSYTFDLGNRMSAAPGRATYTYDGWGRRSTVVGTDGQTRVQVYSRAGQLLYTTAGTASPTKFIYLDNHVIAEVK